MSYAINFLVLMTLFFAGMAQANAMDKHTAYWIAGASAVIAFSLAIVRYSQQKKAGK